MSNEGYLNHLLTFARDIKVAIEMDKAHIENHRKKNGDVVWCNVAHAFNQIAGTNLEAKDMKALYYNFI